MTPSVYLTGLGAISPLGLDAPTTWAGLLDGRSGVATISAFDASGLSTRIAAEVSDFDPATVLTGKRLRRSTRSTQMAVAAARQAVADAGIRVEDEDPGRVGVVVNTAVAGFDTVEVATRQLLGRGVGRIGPHFVSSSLTNMPACEVAIDLGVHGPVTAGALACASGLYAFLEARRLVAAGEADVVVCGGTDASITPVMFAGLSTMGALSTRNDAPQAASRPFDADRDGFVFGEGAVVGVVESEAHAAARGARPYARIAGGAITADAFHPSAPVPDGAYAAEAIRLAIARGGLGPRDVDLVSAHGTSTAANDRIETAAIRSALGPAADGAAVTAPKSMVGHMIGAAGALGLLVSAMSIRHGLVPPTINLDNPDPECDLDHVKKVARAMTVRVALTNAFGFGGQNCVVALTAPE